MPDPTSGTNQCDHGQLARACEICELQARLAECERENAALKDIPATVYEAVERVLDEESAWIARPSPSVTRRVALSATIACSVAWNESFENAVRREQAMQGMRDYVSQLEDTCDTLRAQLAETQQQLSVQLAVGDKLQAEVARLTENLARVQSAARTGMDAAKVISSAQLAQAARLRAESNPDALESERAMNATLTAENEKLEAELAALRVALEEVDRWDIQWADGLDSNVERIKTIVRDALGG